MQSTHCCIHTDSNLVHEQSFTFGGQRHTSHRPSWQTLPQRQHSRIVTFPGSFQAVYSPLRGHFSDMNERKPEPPQDLAATILEQPKDREDLQSAHLVSTR